MSNRGETKTRYWEGVGRRKTAVARVKIFPLPGDYQINGKPPAQFFAMPRLVEIAVSPLKDLGMDGKLMVKAKVVGGGVKSQAEAVRHGLARALVLYNSELKKRLRALGYLTRDPRMVERKKYGLKKARRAPQWSKR